MMTTHKEVIHELTLANEVAGNNLRHIERNGESYPGQADELLAKLNKRRAAIKVLRTQKETK